jgi:hypothetical protein
MAPMNANAQHVNIDTYNDVTGQTNIYGQAGARYNYVLSLCKYEYLAIARFWIW